MSRRAEFAAGGGSARSFSSIEEYESWAKEAGHTPRLTPRESGAVWDWRINPRINEVLRAGTPLDAEDRMHVRKMDSAIAKAAPLAEDVTAYRIIRDSRGMDLSPGAVVDDPGYVATAPFRGYTEHVRRGNIEGMSMRPKEVPAMMRLRIPAGTQALALEQELLLARGTRLHITGVDDDDYLRAEVRRR